MTEPRLGGRYVVRISVDDVGSRVSIRCRTGEDADGPAYTDTLGLLERWEDGILSIRRRDGSLAEVAETAMVAGKVLPPAPQRRTPRR